MTSGKWLRPTQKILFRYSIILLAGLVIDYGLKVLLFKATVHRIHLFLGINLDPIFLKITNPLAFDIIASVFITTWLLILPLFFRLDIPYLDRWWLEASDLVFAGMGNIFERIFTGGVYYIFSITNGLRYLCIAHGIRFKNYYWNPSDFYVSMYFYSFVIVLLVYCARLILKSSQNNTK